MNFYVISQKKDSGSHLGLLDAVLYDREYENYDEVQYGYFPWYENSNRKRPHTKMPAGMVLVGKSKKYYFGARRLARGLFAISEKFYSACVSAGVNFVDVEKVSFKVGGNSSDNPVGYYVAVFKSYSGDDVVDPSSRLTLDEYGRIKSFDLLRLQVAGDAVFRVDGVSSSIDTLYCTESFKDKAESLGVLGVEFISLAENGSEGIFPL